MLKKIKNLLFKNTTAKQTIVKNVVWLGMSQFIGKLIRGLFIIFAARLLGASEYGVFSYALGLAGFFTLFADLGINSILTKEASREPERSSFHFATSFWIKIFLVFFAVLLIIFVAPYFSKIESIKTLFYFVALLTIFDNLREFFNAYFRAKEKMEFEALVNVSMNIAIAVIGAIVLYHSQTAKAVTISYVGSAGIGLLIAGFIIQKEFKKIISAFDKKLIQPIMKAALPIAIMGFLGVFMLNIDIIIIGWFRSTADIGLYSAGQKIVQLLYTMPVIIAGALFPALSRAASNKDSLKVSLIMEKGMAATFAFAIPITLGGIILAGPIINMLYGAEYLPAVLTFQILLLTNIVIFPQTLLSNFVLAHNKQKKLAFYIGLAALGNVILDIIFIPKFGIAGSATATVIVQTIYIFFTWNMIKKINPFKTIANLKKIFIASALVCITAFVFNYLNMPVIINILASGAIYLLALLILKEPIIKEGKSAILNRN